MHHCIEVQNLVRHCMYGVHHDVADPSASCVVVISMCDSADIHTPSRGTVASHRLLSHFPVQVRCLFRTQDGATHTQTHADETVRTHLGELLLTLEPLEDMGVVLNFIMKQNDR